MSTQPSLSVHVNLPPAAEDEAADDAAAEDAAEDEAADDAEEAGAEDALLEAGALVAGAVVGAAHPAKMIANAAISTKASTTFAFIVLLLLE